jgi:magnesium transporter
MCRLLGNTNNGTAAAGHLLAVAQPQPSLRAVLGLCVAPVVRRVGLPLRGHVPATSRSFASIGASAAWDRPGGQESDQQADETLSVPQYGGREELDRTNLVRAITVDEAGSFREVSLTKADLSRELRVQKRDLRAVDVSFPNQLACFLVRDGVILINLEAFKAIVKHNSLILFTTETARGTVLQQFCPFLQYRLTREVGAHVGGGFEFRVARIDHLLFGLEQATNGQDDYLPFLADLSHHNKTLNSFQKRVHEVRGALHQVLESDEDLAAMYLSVQAATGHRRRTDQHEEAEILIENYVAQLDDVLSEVAELQSSIDVSEEYFRLTLDSQRNKIMKMNLLLTLGTFSTACAGVVTGVFGMNLQNFLETSESAFLVTTGGLTISMAASFASIYTYFRLKKML